MKPISKKFENLDVDNQDLSELIRLLKNRESERSEFVERKTKEIYSKVQISPEIVKKIEELSKNVGKNFIRVDGVEYVSIRGENGVDVIVDKDNPRRHELTSWKEETGNKLLEELGADFRFHVTTPDFLYFSPMRTYEKYEKGDYLIGLEILDEIILNCLYLENGQYFVKTSNGKFEVLIEEGAIVNIEKIND